MELRSNPLTGEAPGLLALAQAAHEEGRLEDARMLARQVVETDPSNLEALLLLGVIAAKQGRPKLCQLLLGQVIQADRRSFYGHYWLSLSLHRSGMFQDALGMAERAVAVNAADAPAQSQLGVCYLSLDRRHEALGCFQIAAGLDPSAAPIFDNLGRAQRELGDFDGALASFRRSVELDGSRAPVLVRLGEALLDRMGLDEAEQVATRAVELDSGIVPAQTLLVKILLARGQAVAAEEHAREAIRLSSADPSPHTLYGNVLEALGRFDEAVGEYRYSIQLEPRQGFSYFALVRLGSVDPPLVTEMARLRHEAAMPKRDLAYLDYALGKVREDRGEYQVAMASYDQANLLTREQKFGSMPFDPKPSEESLLFALQNWDSEFLSSATGSGSDDETPIFVIGMMRSGTTLAEQILSCHPDIGASGEQLFWPERYSEALMPPGNRVDPGHLRELADEYFALLKGIGPGKARIVDKMPDNFKLLGLLYAAFPKARFIHLSRDPIDTCLSVWTTPNQGRLEWAHDKANIVFAYEQYLSFMAHWRSVLPPGRILEVSYEKLVSDREAMTRQLIEFCGVPWDNACLAPEKNSRSVSTPSVWQVRQPVYGTSVARWRLFEPWIGDFAKLPPVEAAALAGEGQVRLRQGRIEEANRLFERSIEVNPRQGFAYFALSYSRRVSDPEFVDRMEKVLEDSRLTAAEKMDIEFALGKAKEDLGEYELAMNHFNRAHERYEKGAPLDEVAYQMSLDFSIRTFDREFLARNRGAGSPDDIPIFVVGMIRSGTTLAEQILSCHPDIGSAGEQPFWSDHRADALLPPGNVLDPTRMNVLTDEYGLLLRQLAPGAARVVDKMPNNYLHLGVLAAAYPNARIIHMRRDPVDTCLSIWKTPNQARLDWCHSKHEIVFTYRSYLRLMEHWRSVLPADRFLEFRYEHLVSNQEAVTRRMVEFCGLEWSAACLHPEANTRPVLTPSAWQVRQPLYSTSVERWRKYEPWLGEFAELQ